jgi:hypothetical protein
MTVLRTLPREEQVAIRLRYGDVRKWYKEKYRPDEVHRYAVKIREEVCKVLKKRKKDEEHSMFDMIRWVLDHYRKLGTIESYDVIPQHEHGHITLHLNFGDFHMQCLLDPIFFGWEDLFQIGKGYEYASWTPQAP